MVPSALVYLLAGCFAADEDVWEIGQSIEQAASVCAAKGGSWRLSKRYRRPSDQEIPGAFLASCKPARIEALDASGLDVVVEIRDNAVVGFGYGVHGREQVKAQLEALTSRYGDAVINGTSVQQGCIPRPGLSHSWTIGPGERLLEATLTEHEAGAYERMWLQIRSP